MNDVKDDDDGKRKVPVYRVGRGKPPLHSQFQPGVSGNPSGKRKRPRDPWEAMEELLANRTCSVTIDNKRQQVPCGDALIMSLLNDAMKGKPAAIKIVMDLWMGGAGKSDRRWDDVLSPADEEVLKALRIPQVGSSLTATLAGELRLIIDPDGTMSLEADDIEDGLVSRFETEIADAIAAGGEPVEVIEALLSSMRLRNPPTDGVVAVSESVTSILQKGDGTVEIRSS